jgi:hypothetical protein
MLAGLVFIVACVSAILPELHISTSEIVDRVKPDAVVKKTK